MYLGLDLAAEKADWAATVDGQHFDTGTVRLSECPELLAALQPVAVAMEYTGRRAEAWSLCAEKHSSADAYILHSALRRSMVNLARQTTKTDKEDAINIARYLRLWHDPHRRREMALPSDLFTEAKQTRVAWTLRGLLAACDALTRERTKAKQRYIAARQMGLDHLAEIWYEHTKSKDPENALSLARDFAREHFSNELDLLLGVPHIGDKIALALIARLMPIERFTEFSQGKDRTLRNIRRYVGFVPDYRQSGDTAKTERYYGGQRVLKSLLFVGARSCATPSHTDQFAREYRARVQRGTQPGKAMYLVAVSLLSCAVAILRSGNHYVDPDDPDNPKYRRKMKRPEYLLTQTEAAAKLGVSKQRVNTLIKNGRLKTETYEDGGKRVFVNAESVDHYALTKGKEAKP